MPPAIINNTSDDTFIMWQSENGAAYCNRMSATFTAVMCERNQIKTGFDYRCNGCGGLYNQYSPPQAQPLYIQSATDENGAIVAQYGIIDEIYDEPEADNNLADVELDLDDEQLLALFPDFVRKSDKTEDTETHYQRFMEQQKAAKRRVIYNGRCKRCGGYVENIREYEDYNVFRCLACGWRTGPEYEFNRKPYGVYE